MIRALNFVPIADTIQPFDAQYTHVGNAEQVILDYFETNFIGVTTRKMLATYISSCNVEYKLGSPIMNQ